MVCQLISKINRGKRSANLSLDTTAGIYHKLVRYVNHTICQNHFLSLLHPSLPTIQMAKDPMPPRHRLYLRRILQFPCRATGLKYAPSRRNMVRSRRRSARVEISPLPIDSNHRYQFRNRRVHFHTPNNGSVEAKAILSSQTRSFAGVPYRFCVCSSSNLNSFALRQSLTVSTTERVSHPS